METRERLRNARSCLRSGRNPDNSMPDKAPLERLGKWDIRRTGWMSDARRCPVHGDLLELCFDETDYDSWPPHYQAALNHDDNRVRWRCAACFGSWLENFFLEEERTPPVEEVRLVLKCPDCSGRRLRHECVPACCGMHRCIDCDSPFDLKVDLLETGTKKERQPFTMQGSVPFSTPRFVDPAYRSGWVRPFRRCPKHGSPLELVFIPFTDGKPPTLLAWHCDDCDESWTEPIFRRLQLRFAPEGSAGAECPHCRSDSVWNLGTSEDLAVCRDCQSTLRLWLQPRME